MNRKRLILFILMIVFGIAALWSYSAIPRLKTAGPARRPTAEPRTKPVDAVKGAPVKNADNGTRLYSDLLDREPAGFTGYRRNMFRPIFADDTKMVTTKIAIPPPPPVLPPAPVQPVAMLPQTPPLAHFTFLGFMKSGVSKTIFLTKEKDILLVKKGDKIADRYEATDITDQTLTLTTTDTKEQIVIPLVENRSLAPAR
jgi:hypothetical protein